MKYCLLLLAMFLLISCSFNSGKFDRKVWLEHPDMTEYSNPRIHMFHDLTENHLHIGMSRESVLMLLGKPYKDGIEYRVPDNISPPDSLSLLKPENLKGGRGDIVLALHEKFRKEHEQPDTLMMYSLGPSTADYWFLTIIFNDKGRVKQFIKYQS